MDDLILILLLRQKYLEELKLKNFNKAYQWYLRERLFVDFINKRENSLLKEFNLTLCENNFLDLFLFLLEKDHAASFDLVKNRDNKNLFLLYSNPFISNRFLLFQILGNNLDSLDSFDNSLVSSNFILPIFREYSFSKDIFLFKNIFNDKIDFSFNFFIFSLCSV